MIKKSKLCVKNVLEKEGYLMAECGKKCEVYSRIVGYFRPVQNWNPGKKEEFNDRKMFNGEAMINSPCMCSHLESTAVIK